MPLFRKQKSNQSSQRPTSLGIPTNTTADQQFQALGTSTRTPERENFTRSKYVLLWSLRLVFIILMTLQVREREPGIHSDTTNEQVGQNSPDTHSLGTKRSGSQDRENGDQGAAAERKCRCPGNILLSLTSISREGGPEGWGSWGRHRFVGCCTVCRAGIRPPQSRPGCHLCHLRESRSSFTTPCPDYSLMNASAGIGSRPE